MASIFARLLTHTYTLTPRAQANINAIGDDGVRAPVNGNAVTNTICFFNPSEALRTDEQGRVTIRGPVLLVGADDPIDVGDRVSSVSGGGLTLEAGPLTVDVIDRLTLGGGVEIKRAKLKRALSAL